ncbi:hypothetical protein J6590_035560 [Homalodisca vitripennis]|nr:hypothetical protein J6590_035560 [Homalodisca vitripennis]
MRIPLHIDYSIYCGLSVSDVERCNKFVMSFFVTELFWISSDKRDSRFQESTGWITSTLWAACPRVFKQYFSKLLDRQKRKYRVVTKIARSISN